MGLGPLDNDFGLVEARDRAAELRRMIRRGVDPLRQPRALIYGDYSGAQG